jgi:hypothetical protein
MSASAGAVSGAAEEALDGSAASAKSLAMKTQTPRTDNAPQSAMVFIFILQDILAA